MGFLTFIGYLCKMGSYCQQVYRSLILSDLLQNVLCYNFADKHYKIYQNEKNKDTTYGRHPGGADEHH